jgi:cytochrome c peroxidase
VEDTGHDLFHHDASETSHISCASCHLEGHDDGHTWVFDTIGARRTQTLGGDIFETAPFHWDGDMQNLGAIMDNVFVNRMGGSKQGPRHVSVMQDWMGSIPRLPVSAPVADTTALKHGADLFQQSCASCHAGSLMTNNSNKDVGTGGSFQVPSLIGISNRAPYLHDGSAATLRDRFYVPNADKHVTPGSPKLSDQDVTDLVTYLETL